MIKLENLGYHTDCIARKLEGEFLERDGYAVLRTPANPTYYWGNLLVFKEAPGPGDFEKWISIHVREFGENTGHVTFGWESEEIGSVERFVEHGFTLESTSVLVLDTLFRPATSADDVLVREIVSDTDWDAVLKLQNFVSKGEYPDADYVEFKQRLFNGYRQLSRNNCGAWWGAFIGNTLVGDMGLYFDDAFETGRFQSVETHPDHRRKGICSTLLQAVAGHALEQHPGVKLVICSEIDSNAEKIYLKMGFKHHQFQHGVCLERPLKLDCKG